MVNDNPEIPIIQKLEQAGHDITGIKLTSDNQQFISIDNEGIFIELPYEVENDVTIGGSQRAVQFELDVSLDSVSELNQNSTLNQIRVSDVILDPTAPIVQEEISIDMTPSAWSVSIADLELLIEGSLTNKLMDLETIDEANYSIDKVSLRAGEAGDRQDLIVAQEPTTLPSEFTNVNFGYDDTLFL